MNWNFDGYQELYEEDLQRINGGYGDAGVCTTATGDTTIYTQTETVVHTPNTPEPIYTQTETVVHTPNTPDPILTQTTTVIHTPIPQAMPNVAASVNGSTWGTVAQNCSNNALDHCDIIAQNLAINEYHLTNTAAGNLNNMSVNDTYKKYQSSAVQATAQGFVGTGSVVRGYMFFDWEKKETSPGSDEWVTGDLGDMDHMEFCEISADGRSYTVWQNNGTSEPVKTLRYFSDDHNGKGGGRTTGELSTMSFVRLQ